MKIPATLIPAPESRISPVLYKELREFLLANDPDAQGMLEWSNHGRSAPSVPEHLAGDIIWIILCAGRKAQAARTIEKRVSQAIDEGRPVLEVFGHKGKAAAIEHAWKERDRLFKEISPLIAAGDVEASLAWCKSQPFVGEDTQFQLAKNLGFDLCKPDIWLCRLAGIPDRPKLSTAVRFRACMDLCRSLAPVSSDIIAAIDSLLWLACNKGILRVSADAGPVEFIAEQSKLGRIL